ncbi:glycosyltransferase family 2 protein [Candidatus Gottesmanbacteria bacterium]|nr:glycosyltransferase family 2 protein [Candidatus Gottesmanbacteria bacterium]
MLVSVVIPAYNEEKYLPKTLESLKDQAHSDFDYEVIVVDSQSRDKTTEVAQRYGAQVLSIPKKTPAFARQKGVEQAKGEIIICLDADTLAPKDLLRTVIFEFKKDPNLVGLTGIIDGWGGALWQNFLYKWVNALFAKLNYFLGRPGFQGQSFAFRKEAFLKIGGFRTELHTGEDFDLGIRMAKIGKVKFLLKTFGVSSLRRTKEGLSKTVSRGFLSYLRVVWRLPFGKPQEKKPFPAIR